MGFRNFLPSTDPASADQNDDAFEQMLEQVDDRRLERIGEMCYQLGIALQQRNRGLAAIFIRSLTPLLSQDELSGAAETLAALSNGDAIESAGWFSGPKMCQRHFETKGVGT